jgi:hypothetical protein
LCQSLTVFFNPLNAKLNPICHLLALLGAHPILHVSRIRVKMMQISLTKSVIIIIIIIIITMSNIPGNHKVKELQKTTILGTAHILRKVLTYRYNGVNAGTSDIRTMNSYIRVAATRCFLGTWFVSGIYV